LKIFFEKQASPMRRSSVLSLPSPQLVFPGLARRFETVAKD
jgi:hypothetical protein